MRFLCFGMGAIGTYIGGSLASAGNDVTFLERSVDKGTHDLHLEFKDRTIDLRAVKAASTLQAALEMGPFDAAILAVKSFDTPGVLAEIEPLVQGFPPILCLQNGVENEDLIAGVLGQDRIIGGSVTSAVRRTGVGSAVVERSRGIGIEGRHPISNELISKFNEAGLNARGYPDRASLKWSKMLTNLQANALCAILNWTPYQVFSSPASYAIECAAIGEAVDVMKVQDIQMVDLPGTPVKAWVTAMTRWPEWLSRPVIARVMGAARGRKLPSFHIDLYAGRKQSEVIFLNGAVVRAAEKAGLPAPVNQVLTEILTGMAQGTIPFDQYNNQPMKIRQHLLELL